jgi:serine O-acetyltransferase
MNFLQTLKADLQFIKTNDPAAKLELEILLCYPGLHAVYLHKIAYWLYQNKLFLLARFVSSSTRFWTGVEIHPGAKIANKVFIDHGSGVVIGETAVVEEEVIIYQGVTLGGTSSKPEKRHPTIKKGAVIGAHAQVLGNIVVGENSRVGSGSVAIKNVEPNSTVVGIPARATDKANIDKLDHQHIPDLLLSYIKKLENELEELKHKS